MNTKRFLRASHIITLLAVTTVIAGLYSVSAVSLEPVMHVSGTVAGYGTTIEIDGLKEFQPVSLAITNPKNQANQFADTANASGKMSYTLDDSYTGLAGSYDVRALSRSTNALLASGTFTISADAASPDNSGVVVSKDIVHIGSYDFATISVKLTDASGNPIKDHILMVVSDRTSDIVKPFKTGVSRTDSNGIVAFAVTSTTAGQSHYTVYDTSTQKAIGTPVSVLYLPSTQASANSPFSANVLGAARASVLGSAVGGDVVAVAGAQAGLESGPADNFKFEAMPDAVKSNQPIDFTVTAYDVNQKLAVGYLGTVSFKATGDNAVYASLPKDYTFTSTDLGSHIFPLAMQFQQEGTYEIDVTDTKNPLAKGHLSLVVKGGSATTAVDTKVVITTPSPGSYSTGVQTVTGTAPAGKDVKLYDGTEVIGSTVTSIQGQYSIVTKALTDGDHELTVSTLDQAGAVLGTSDKVKITIDTVPPKIDSLVLTPGFDATPALPIQVELHSEGKMKKSILDVNGTTSELTEDLETSGVYHGSFAAPDKDGTYDLKFTLSDSLGNEAVITYETKLHVVTAGGLIKPVTGVTAAGGPFKATLKWKAPEGDLAKLDHYRIYYGTDPNDLKQKADTKGNVLTWYIPNLQNSVQYYFGVVAVDKDGYTGEPGTLAVATPTEDRALGPVGLPVADSFVSTMGLRGKTGPEIFWLLPLSAGIGGFIKRRRK